jgi:hypothetical protein
VTVREGGFPSGFLIDQLQLHVYEKGVEIPTDVSENRVGLTWEEAHEYLVIEYISANKDATKKPQIALFQFPADWKEHRTDRPLQNPYYVKVDKTGRPVGVFQDEACTEKAGDAYVSAALSNLLFLPALEKGKPVEGVALVVPVNLRT